MRPGDLPPADFASRPLPLTPEAVGSVWQRIYAARFPDALGYRPALSRFSDPSGTRYGLVYVGSSSKVAFAEAVLRDRAIGTLDPFPITLSELQSFACADITIARTLNLVDLTGDGHLRLRVPTDVTGATDQTLARVWSQAFYDHPAAPDGVLYSSRLNNERNIAIYDRAVGKLAVRVVPVPRLVDRATELVAILTDFKLALI